MVNVLFKGAGDYLGGANGEHDCQTPRSWRGTRTGTAIDKASELVLTMVGPAGSHFTVTAALNATKTGHGMP